MIKIVLLLNLIVSLNFNVFSQLNKLKGKEIKAKVIVDFYASANPFELDKTVDYKYFIEIRPYCQGKHEGVYIVDYDQLTLNGIITKRANKALKLPDINFIGNRKFVYTDLPHYRYKYKTSFVLDAKWIKYGFSHFEPNESKQKYLYFTIVGDTTAKYNYYILKDTISTRK